MPARRDMRHALPLATWLKLAVALCVVTAGVAANVARRPIERPAGMLVTEAPWQSDSGESTPFTHASFELVPRARFALKARLLAAERYRFDGGAALSPIDFALGWGPMSDSKVLDEIRITQGSRFYTIYTQTDQVDIALLLRHSANMHLIPADDGVERVLRSARVGHLVRLEGLLVDASRADGYRWRTSLTRNDSGAGACELFYVADAQIL